MPEVHYFLAKDLDALDRSIQEIDDRIRDILGQAGDGCRGRSDTWHDNFEHEDGIRTSAMWSSRLRELISIRRSARLVTPTASGDEVFIGRTVTVEDQQTHEVSIFQIGSYMTLSRQDDDRGVVSYAAPLAKIIAGSKAGDIRQGEIGGQKKTFKILEVK